MKSQHLLKFCRWNPNRGPCIGWGWLADLTVTTHPRGDKQTHRTHVNLTEHLYHRLSLSKRGIQFCFTGSIFLAVFIFFFPPYMFLTTKTQAQAQVSLCNRLQKSPQPCENSSHPLHFSHMKVHGKMVQPVSHVKRPSRNRRGPGSRGSWLPRRTRSSTPRSVRTLRLVAHFT